MVRLDHDRITVRQVGQVPPGSILLPLFAEADTVTEQLFVLPAVNFRSVGYSIRPLLFTLCHIENRPNRYCFVKLTTFGFQPAFIINKQKLCAICYKAGKILVYCVSGPTILIVSGK